MINKEDAEKKIAAILEDLEESTSGDVINIIIKKTVDDITDRHIKSVFIDLNIYNRANWDKA